MSPELGHIGHGTLQLFISTVVGSSLNERAGPVWSPVLYHVPFPLLHSVLGSFSSSYTDSLPSFETSST